MILSEAEIEKRIINNNSLFNYIHVVHQNFDIIPSENKHYGTSIEYQDLSELREEFLDELYDTIVSWVYNSEKYAELKTAAISKGKSEDAAASEVQRKAHQKFRGNKSSESLLVQGQLGELLLFHFIQRFEKAAPLLRKMKITTSNKHERFGADAIHFKYENDKPVIILGEAKTYTSEYRFNQALDEALKSILATWKSHRDELNLYVHEDFLDDEMNEIAERYLNNKLPDVKVRLVSIVVYNETDKLNLTDRDDILKQIDEIIEKRYKNFDNNKINIDENAILKRITYIVMPIWKLDELAQSFQDKI
ncbi:MAG: DUF1837 domain-containing protein [Clostridia bacterium]|nr:DUF1837 domain-containing protein [Clostridia bacterium]